MRKIKIKTPYITLGQFLKLISLIGSGGEAKIFLQYHKVLINDEPDNRRGRKIYPDDVVIIDSEEYIVKSNENL